MKPVYLILIVIAGTVLISIAEVKMIRHDTIDEMRKIKQDTIYLPNPVLDTVYIPIPSDSIVVSCDHSEIK